MQLIIKYHICKHKNITNLGISFGITGSLCIRNNQNQNYFTNNFLGNYGHLYFNNDIEFW